jgi:hypothetical protein
MTPKSNKSVTDQAIRTALAEAVRQLKREADSGAIESDRSVIPDIEIEAIVSRITARIAVEMQTCAPLPDEKVDEIVRRVRARPAGPPAPVISDAALRTALSRALDELQPVIPSSRYTTLLPAVARYRRLPEREFVVHAGTGAKWATEKELGVRWHQTPRDPGRFFFFFSAAPELCLGLVTTRLTDGSTVQALFPLRKSCLRNEWEGECDLATGGALEILDVESLTLSRAADFLRSEDALARQFAELVATWGFESVADDPDSPRYADVWKPLTAPTR